MISVDTALETIVSRTSPLEAIEVPLNQARDRAIAGQIRAVDPVPPFDNSAMDGYAVRADDTRGATEGRTIRLEVVADLPAGRAPDREVLPGSAIRIMTGAPIPPGADAVIMVEETRRNGSGVLILAAAEPGQHVRAAGDDVACGQVVFEAGDPVTSAAMALLASVGVASVSVTRRPRVALLTTGDEVVDPGVPLGPGKIRNSNRVGLCAQIEEAGASLASVDHAPDDPTAVRNALTRAAAGADLIVATGGVSVGDYDFMKQVIEELGRIDFWRVAVRPGKPIAVGQIGQTPLFGLPGNPVSAMLTFELFARPAIRRLAGFRQTARPMATGTLMSAVKHIPGRREYQRVKTEWHGDELRVFPAPGQGSHQLLGLAHADALAVIPEDSEGLAPGDAVRLMLLP